MLKNILSFIIFRNSNSIQKQNGPLFQDISHEIISLFPSLPLNEIITNYLKCVHFITIDGIFKVTDKNT